MATATMILLAGCTPGDVPGQAVLGRPFASYLSEDLLSVSLTFTGEPSLEQLRSLTDCAAAEAALERDGNFLRHVRTSRADEGGNSRADAVYNVSKQIPAGPFVLDAGVVAENCRTEGTLGV